LSTVLQDVWLPEVKSEYRALLKVNRDVASDVGNQMCEFIALLQDWEERAWKSIAPVGGAYLYGVYGMYASMFFAVSGQSAAVVKWMLAGTEYQQSQGRHEAEVRALRLFPRKE
jgi:hypothetical protein